MIVPVIVLAITEPTRSTKIGTIAYFEPPGSLSSDEPDGTRNVYMFGWLDGERGVWKSLLGIDTANTAFRSIHSMGFEKLSDLNEPYDLTIYRNRLPRQVRVAATVQPMEAGSRSAGESSSPAPNVRRT